MRRLWLGAALLCAGGCLQEQRYVVENQSVALTEDTPVAFVNEDDDELFIVTRPFELPIRPLSDQNRQQLVQRRQGRELPYPRMPWVELHDLELQVDYVLANQSDDTVTASIFLDGRNEFHLYTPGPEDFHQWERRFTLAPKQRVHGTVTELEMDEVAVDLATVVNGAPNSNQVVHVSSQSGRDERSRQFIPSVVPGLVGFSAGLMANSATNVVLEISVRAQDHGDRLAERGARRWQLPDAMPFVPVAPEED